VSSGRPRADVDRMTSLEVDNLPHRTSPDRLWRIFRKYGRVGDVYIPRVPYSREALGFALVRFPNRRDAQDSEDALDGDLRSGPVPFPQPVALQPLGPALALCRPPDPDGRESPSPPRCPDLCRGPGTGPCPGVLTPCPGGNPCPRRDPGVPPKSPKQEGAVSS
uniref:RRM domain-containing protein n=1 Tax=Prolemur simus TaxID=1328070 RepID=A0A8C8YK23_PROSS